MLQLCGMCISPLFLYLSIWVDLGCLERRSGASWPSWRCVPGTILFAWRGQTYATGADTAGGLCQCELIDVMLVSPYLNTLYWAKSGSPTIYHTKWDTARGLVHTGVSFSGEWTQGIIVGSRDVSCSGKVRVCLEMCVCDTGLKWHISTFKKPREWRVIVSRCSERKPQHSIQKHCGFSNLYWNVCWP